jgi:hypothetical protein
MRRFLYLLVFNSCIANQVQAEAVSISCGSSTGYAYYFEGGIVSNEKVGFKEDGITGGGLSLTLNGQEADILAKDASGEIKSARAQGGKVFLSQTEGAAYNWVVFYPDGTIEVYSYHGATQQVVSYRNTVGNALVAKNSLFVADCD